MLTRILNFSIEHRFLVVLLVAAAAAVGVFSLQRCPSTPCPTSPTTRSRSTRCRPRFRPTEVEKQITFPVETALAGIPGLQSTRSLSRNGFSQVTASSTTTSTSISPASRSTSGWPRRRRACRPAPSPRWARSPRASARSTCGPSSTSTPAARAPRCRTADPGWQADGSYLTPEGQRLATEVERPAYLRTVQDWIIRPQLKGVQGVAGVDAIGGYVKQYHVQPDPMKLVAYGLTFTDVIEALERNNVSTGAGYIERKGESYMVRAAGRIENREQIGDVVVGDARAARRSGSRDVADGRGRAANCAPAAPARTGRRSSSARR